MVSGDLVYLSLIRVYLACKQTNFIETNWDFQLDRHKNMQNRKSNKWPLKIMY